MAGFEPLPDDAQIDPIPDGFEALPDGAELEQVTQGLPDAEYRQRLHSLIAAGKPREEIDNLIRGQGIDPAQVTGIDAALAAARQGRQFGVHSVDGSTTTDIAPETAGQALYRGVGDVAAGVGDVLGLVANPLNAGINAVAGTNLSTDLGETFRDWTGAPRAITDQERYLSAAGRFGASGLATAGLGATATGASGAAGTVARAVAANPTADLVSGVAGGIGSEAGQDIGGTPGAIIGGLAGGVAGLGVAKAVERLAARMPAEVALNGSGGLTPEGHEMALRAGVRDDDLVETYARARQRSLVDNRSGAERQAAREAVRNRPQADVEIIAQDGTPMARTPQEPPDLSGQSQRIIDAAADNIPSASAVDGVPPTNTAGRFDEANSEGVRLTRGQAEQNFEVQNDENSLRVSATNEGEQARQFFQGQQRQIGAAVDRFRSAFGADAGNAADRGAILKDAVTQLRDAGADGVRALYRQAEELGGEGLRLETRGIQDAATDVLIDEAVPEGVKKAVSQELARYGIIGEAAPTNEAGITRVTLDDGSSVAFRGPVKQLTASNADDLRKAINRLYLSDPTRVSQSIKPAIDDALGTALEGAANGPEAGIASAYGAARDAHRVQRGTFHAKDIIDNLTANKKGTNTPVLLPEKAIAQVIGAGAKGVSNLRQTRALLLSSGTDHGRAAWGAIQHQGIADIFDKAWSRNVNYGNGQIGDIISGAKLNSAIEAFGVDKLRTLLEPAEFNGLMKLRRIIGNATIPISGTVNPSGTATKIINYMRQGTLRFAGAIPGVGGAVNAFAGLAAKGKEIAATRRTLEGITSFDGRQSTSNRLDQQARAFVAEYIESGKSGRLVPTSINLSTPRSGSDK